eukprot:10065360-Heterocapsa_arctica.AAC.1
MRQQVLMRQWPEDVQQPGAGPHDRQPGDEVAEEVRRDAGMVVRRQTWPPGGYATPAVCNHAQDRRARRDREE